MDGPFSELLPSNENHREMPRTQKYAVNESLASSQQTIISRINDNKIPIKDNISEVTVRQRGFSTGWCIAILFGVICFAFIMCVAFVRLPGVPHNENYRTSKLLQKKGSLKVYPSIRNENSSLIGSYFFPLPADSVTSQLEQILDKYPEYTDVYTYCFGNNPTYEKPCYFEKNMLGSKCTKEENNFGYTENNGTFSPCILLQFANTTNWQPEVFRNEDINESWRDIYDPNSISVGCAEVKGIRDVPKLESIEIFPEKGFSNQFFPVTGYNSSLYLAPSVMIQFRGLKVGVKVTVQCWIRVTNAYILEDNGQVTFIFYPMGTPIEQSTTDQFTTVVTQTDIVAEQSDNITGPANSTTEQTSSTTQFSLNDPLL